MTSPEPPPHELIRIDKVANATRRKDLKLLTVAEVVLRSSPNSATNDSTRGYTINPFYAKLIKKYGSKNWEQEVKDNLKGIEQSRYITIETGVRPKPNCDYAKNDPHKYIHTLLLCYEQNWWQLEYVKSRTPVERIQHYSQCDD